MNQKWTKINTKFVKTKNYLGLTDVSGRIIFFIDGSQDVKDFLAGQAVFVKTYGHRYRNPHNLALAEANLCKKTAKTELMANYIRELGYKQ